MPSTEDAPILEFDLANTAVIEPSAVMDPEDDVPPSGGPVLLPRGDRAGGDDLSGDAWDERGWLAHVDGRERLFSLAAEAALRL